MNTTAPYSTVHQITNISHEELDEIIANTVLWYNLSDDLKGNEYNSIVLETNKMIKIDLFEESFALVAHFNAYTGDADIEHDLRKHITRFLDVDIAMKLEWRIVSP